LSISRRNPKYSLCIVGEGKPVRYVPTVSTVGRIFGKGWIWAWSEKEKK